MHKKYFFYASKQIFLCIKQKTNENLPDCMCPGDFYCYDILQFSYLVRIRFFPNASKWYDINTD